MTVLFLVFMLAGCLKQRFYPDPFDPELSRLTAKKFQTGTCYINEVVYINYWPDLGISLGRPGLPYPRLTKLQGQGAQDSIDFSWRIEKKDDLMYDPDAYRQITIRIPVASDFTSKDLMSWKGKRFNVGECRVYLNTQQEGGAAGVYFVEVSRHTTEDNRLIYYMSGLFEGSIGNEITIKKGRFDYIMSTSGF